MSSNLKPIRPGQSGADHPRSKPAGEHRAEVVVVRVTASEKAKITKEAAEQKKSLTKWARGKMGLEE